MSLAEKLFGSFSDRELKKINPITKKVLALETKYQPMSDAELQAQTPALKERLANGETLDDILPDAFAVCREAAWRVLGMKHFPVQIMGGIALHRGSIAEMQTGEGKTLVATLPAYLNALTGEGVHIVTVNDYLAKRDSEWMGKLYRWLGLNVGLIVQGIDGDARRRAYNADITYGTNNEYGFDYLRDNMVTYKDNMVQRGHAFAIVDEVDSILIDEARTPLIISGKGEDSSVMYNRADDFAKTLKKSVIVEPCFGFLNAAFGQGAGLVLFVHNVITVNLFIGFHFVVQFNDDRLFQRFGKVVRALVHHAGIFALAGDDQRGTGFINQDGVHLVHDGVSMVQC